MTMTFDPEDVIHTKERKAFRVLSHLGNCRKSLVFGRPSEGAATGIVKKIGSHVGHSSRPIAIARRSTRTTGLKLGGHRRTSAMLATVTALAYAHAQRIVALALKATMNDINGIVDAKLLLRLQPCVPPTGLLPIPRERPVHGKDYVEALITLVHDAPWATRSRELRALLGLRKDRFLRIVIEALATGRIVRTGFKASTTYLPAKNGRALAVAKIRMAAGARPKPKLSAKALNALQDLGAPNKPRRSPAAR